MGHYTPCTVPHLVHLLERARRCVCGRMSEEKAAGCIGSHGSSKGSAKSFGATSNGCARLSNGQLVCVFCTRRNGEPKVFDCEAMFLVHENTDRHKMLAAQHLESKLVGKKRRTVGPVPPSKRKRRIVLDSDMHSARIVDKTVSMTGDCGRLHHSEASAHGASAVPMNSVSSSLSVPMQAPLLSPAQREAIRVFEQRVAELRRNGWERCVSARTHKFRWACMVMFIYCVRL